MRFLWNLPLLGALLTAYGFVYMTLLSDQPRFGDAGLGANLLTFTYGLGCALLLGVALVGCVNTGAFEWLSVGRIGALVVVLGVFALLVALLLMPIAATVDTHNEHIVAGRDVSLPIVWLARLVFYGLPLALMAYAGWLINAPLGVRDGLALRFAVLGVIAALSAIAAFATYAEVKRESAKSAAQKAATERAETTRETAQRGGVAALTDSDPLDKWFDYVDHVGVSILPDVHVEAVRRLAARPTLEADLAAALISKNPDRIYLAWSLIDQVSFIPTAALDAPMRAAIAAVADALAAAAPTLMQQSDKNSFIYDNFARHIFALPRILPRLAEGAGIDLRDAVATLAKTVGELYPGSGPDVTLHGEMANLSGTIDAALAAHAKKQ